MKHFVLVSAIAFLAGCSQNYPARSQPTAPPKWTEEEIASYKHFAASLVLVGEIKKELPKLKLDQPAGAQRYDAMCREMLREAELVDPEYLAKAHSDLPRVFEQWYLPWLKDQFGGLRRHAGNPDYGRYARKQWNAWCKANWKNVRSPNGTGQAAGSSETTASRDKKETVLPGWTEDEETAPVNSRGAGGAKKEDDDAVRSDPKYAFAFYNRGNSWFLKRDFNWAIQDYDEAIRIDPKYALAYRGRGFAWFHQEEYEKAIQDFDKVLRLDPKEAYAVVFGYFAARRAPDSAAAARFLNESSRDLRDAWPYPVVKFLRGTIGESQLLKLADNRDKQTEAHCYLGLYHAIMGSKSQAVTHFRWVKDHGDTTFAEYAIAETELERLERRY